MALDVKALKKSASEWADTSAPSRNSWADVLALIALLEASHAALAELLRQLGTPHAFGSCGCPICEAGRSAESALAANRAAGIGTGGGK